MNSKAIKKQLLAAVAMVLVAAVALGSSTYAWFVASGTVKAEGMKVQAQAESGILIKENASGGVFGTVATVSMDAAKLYPTSTTDLGSWYHAVSQKADDAEAEQTDDDAYTLLNENLDQYRLVKQFAIRSATNTAMTKQKLLIKNLNVTGTSTTENLNKAIRVGIKVNTGAAAGAATYIYAPKADGAFTLTAKYDGETVTENTQATANDFLLLANDTIPANDTGLLVDVFIWYEGEDENCKTANVISNGTSLTPDELSVSVEFEAVPTT